MSDFYAQVFSGLQTVANEGGYSVSIYSSGNSAEQEKMNVRSICDRLCDGIVVASGFLAPESIDVLRDTKLPIISVEQILGENDIPYIGITDCDAVYGAVEYLIDIGHKRIACFTAPMQYSVLKERYRGYVSALENNGIGYDPSLVFSDPVFEHAGDIMQYRAVKDILSDRTFTAAVTSSDDTASVILRAAHDLGISVPNELSVIGFDDISIAQFLVPSLTTIRQDAVALGKGAAEMILERIRNGHTENRTVGAELIVRESVTVPHEN